MSATIERDAVQLDHLSNTSDNMSSSSNDTVALVRQEAFKDFSFFDEETVPAVSTNDTNISFFFLFLRYLFVQLKH